ncbi:tail fiber estarase [Bacillus phage 1_ICo-2020]|uniref:Tail fiber estarase n=1 Tax=Bacillus phage 1_ICo-2020 TaxID=2759272 RepID=A0A7G8AKD4_9CAUD|nr:tail fiber estarase [Bacillus phage 1_ICo-2020]
MDLVEKYVPAENVTVVQEDFQSVKFLFTITNREKPADLTGATDIVVSFVKPDGHLVLQNDATLVNGKVELVANPQAFTYVGKIYFQVQYKIGSSIYNTRQAFLWVEKGHTSCQTVSSTDFAPMLDQAIQAGQMLSGIDLQALIDSKVTAENAQKDVDALELRVGALEVTIVGLDSRVDALEVSQAEQDGKITSLQNSQTTLDSKVTSLESGQSSLSSRISSVEGNITIVVNEVDALQLTAVDHETRIDGLETSIPNLDPINTAITTLQAKDVEQDGRIGANELAISGLQTKNTQQDTAIAGNATEIGNLQVEQTTQNNRLTAVENKNASQDSAIGDIQTKDTQQDAAISALQSSQATQDTDIAAIKTKNTQQDTAISANSTSITAIDTKVTANKNAQDTVNAGVTGSLSNHSTRIEALETDATVDDARITNLEGDNTSNKNRISNVEGAIGVLNSDINDLQGNNAVQDSRLNAIETKNTTQDGLIASNSAAITANKADADSKITGLTTRVGTIETDITGLKTKDTQQDTRMTAIENKDATQDARMTTIEGVNTEQNTRLTTLETDFAQNKKKIEYKERQTENLSRFYQKLRSREGTTTIGCVGDSITYGTDLYSPDTRPPYPETFPDGSVNTISRASKTYPESLQEALSEVYGDGKVIVSNMGRSGDYVRSGYNRWQLDTINYNLDCAVLNYGINDARNDGCPYKGDVIVYIQEYRKMIEKFISNGTAIILLSLTKNAPQDRIELDIYANAIKILGAEYGIPVMDSQEIMANYSNTFYSDITHFNGAGFNILGKRIASAFVGAGLVSKMPVQSRSELLTRQQVDNLTYGTGISTIYSTSYPTPDETAVNNGIGLRLNANETVYYNFYVENDLLYTVPNVAFLQPNSSVEFALDFGVEQPEFSNVNSLLRSVDHSYTEPSVLQLDYGSLPFSGINYSLKEVLLSNAPKIMIVRKGWHTLRIKAINNDMNVYGVSFVGLQDLNRFNYNLYFDASGYGVHTRTANGDYVQIRGSGGVGLEESVIFASTNNPATYLMAVGNAEITTGRPLRFAAQATAPTPKKGLMYFDSSTSKLKICEDGVNWVNLV